MSEQPSRYRVNGSEDQTIFKIHRAQRDRFAQILNATIQDGRLSFKATGLLCFLLSMPEDWRANITHLSSVKKEGRDSIIAGFKELKACGYIEKIYVRDKGKIISTVWHVFEEPKSGLPTSVLPNSANPTLQKKQENKETREQKKQGEFSLTSERNNSNPSPKEELSFSEQFKHSPERNISSKIDVPEFHTAWDTFCEYRKEIKHPLKNTSKRALLAQMAEWGAEASIQAISKTIMNGYIGIVDPFKNNGHPKPKPKLDSVI